MSVQIGVATHANVSYEETIRLASKADVAYVELMLEGRGERRRLRDQLPGLTTVAEDIDLLVHLPFGGIDIGAPLEHVRTGSLRELEAGLDVTAALNADKAVFHADTNVRPELWETDRVRSNIFDAAQQLHRYGRERGVEACIENVPGPFVSLRAFPALFEQTDVCMTLDTGHARVSGYSDAELATFVGQYSDRISHIHLNDCRGGRDEHLPVGMGTTDFELILSALPSTWTGTMTIEAITDDFSFVDVGVQRLRSLLERIEK